MTFKHKNCSIILDDGKGRVYKDGRLMFKGDGYIAIKFLLSFFTNAACKINGELNSSSK